MKRFVCLLLVLFLAPVCAFGVSDFEVTVYGHNMYSSLTGAKELEGSPSVQVDGERTIYSYDLDGIDVGFFVEEEKVKTFYCRSNENNVGEFISQCASALYNICGAETLSVWYPYLIDQFLNARAGIESETKPFIQGVCIFSMTYSDGIYTFLAVILY